MSWLFSLKNPDQGKQGPPLSCCAMQRGLTDKTGLQFLKNDCFLKNDASANPALVV